MDIVDIVHGVEDDNHVQLFRAVQSGGSSSGAQPLPPPLPPPPPPQPQPSPHKRTSGDDDDILDTDNDQYS